MLDGSGIRPTCAGTSDAFRGRGNLRGAHIDIDQHAHLRVRAVDEPLINIQLWKPTAHHSLFLDECPHAVRLWQLVVYTGMRLEGVWGFGSSVAVDQGLSGRNAWANKTAIGRW
jgi:hypothetical protein